MKRTDKFTLKVSRGIATSDEYHELTDRERSVYWTAAALMFEPLTFKRLSRSMGGSKIEAAVGRLVEQGFLEVDGEEITLADRWANIYISTPAVQAKRAREKAPEASAPVAAPIPQPAPDRAVAPTPIEPQPAPVVIAESRIPTFPPAENFEDAMPYADDWSDEDFGIDLASVSAAPVFDLPPVAGIPAPAPLVPAEKPTPAPSKAARKREKATSEADQVAAIELPNFLPRETYLAFVNSRNAIKKPLTLQAAQMFIGQCIRAHEDKHDVVDLITRAVIGGWQSIFIPERRGGYADKATAQHAERRRTGGVAL